MEVKKKLLQNRSKKASQYDREISTHEQLNDQAVKKSQEGRKHVGGHFGKKWYPEGVHKPGR